MLEGLDSTKVFEYFEEISNIPRGSGNNTAISNYLVDFAKAHNLKYRKDQAENIIIWKDASKGCETKETVILQGHMDMVCEKEEDSNHDFTKDSLELCVDGDVIYAKGTTLGGDDGIAIAYALAILDDDTLVHPPLEVVITTDEETGMFGAEALDCSDLKGKYFINIDSEEEGTILTSCAGGARVDARFSIGKLKKEGYVMTAKLTGLQGGHSGTEINKNRENAVYMLGRLMTALKHRKVDFRLMNIQGGQKDNAIPRSAEMELLMFDLEEAKKNVMEIVHELEQEMESSEKDANFSVTFSEKQKVDIIDENVTRKINIFMELMPNGIQRMSAAIPGLVESSLNLGICKSDEHEVRFSYSLRSSKKSYKEYMKNKLKDLIKEVGGVFETYGEYPAWEYRADSKLRDVMVQVYKDQYGNEPKIEAIHAGLECGIVSGKMPELDMVSIGPDTFDIHTTKERLSISSTKRVYRFLLTVLERLCD